MITPDGGLFKGKTADDSRPTIDDFRVVKLSGRATGKIVRASFFKGFKMFVICWHGFPEGV
jgi:hypothetical protein